VTGNVTPSGHMRNAHKILAKSQKLPLITRLYMMIRSMKVGC